MSFPYPMNPYDQERELWRARYDAGEMSYAAYLQALTDVDQEEDADDVRNAAARNEAERLWAEEDNET